MQSLPPLEIRPYQLLCLVCRLGAAPPVDYAQGARLDTILAAIRAQPARPLTLRCNVSSDYAWQNPGRAEDTPEGPLFNDRRDLAILHRLGLVPGDTLPALELLERLLDQVPECRGICGFAKTTAPAWTGCRLAASGNYERGRARGAGALIPHRAAEERTATKVTTAAGVDQATTLQIRPHHLLCLTCYHAGRAEFSMLDHDNLGEVVRAMQRNPAIPVTLVQGCCMVCPPCHSYDPATGWCLGGHGMALRDEKKDLDVLQVLGLQYGDILPAHELLQRLYTRVHSTVEICGHGDGVVRGPEWTVCGGAEGNAGYVKGRAAGLGVAGAAPPATANKE